MRAHTAPALARLLWWAWGTAAGLDYHCRLSNEDVARRDREREKKREEAGAQPPAFIMASACVTAANSAAA